MTQSVQQRALDLALNATDLEGVTQDRYLDDACAGDETLRQEVEKILHASGRADRFLGSLAARLGLGADDQTLDSSLAGQRIGPYRVVRLIGRGGMGAVYLAHRDDDQYEQQVAIKLLPLGMDDASSRERFVAERQILARLNHPGIAHLLDGGIADGAPYFVMEYIDGLAIDQYADDNNLSVSDRLKLVEQVCEAVNFAHRNLVVHRDLKPGNVLVTRDGQVKLLDFGIAKLIDSEVARLTAAGEQPMTPRYTSPELLQNEPASTVSDVYSLGVMLYELLAGTGPHDRDEPMSTAAILRSVLEDEIQPPSARVGAQADQVAADRSVDPSKLRKSLQGDLDVIALKALRRKPEHRYQSAAQLADDLNRFRNNLPVVAQAPTLAYQLRKFVKRHRALVASGVVAVLSLITIAGLATYYGITTARQSQQIIVERDRAEEIQQFVLGMFQSVDPNEAKGTTITAKALLDRGATRIQSDLAEQPATQALMLSTIGNMYVMLGLYDEADPLLKEADTVYARTGNAYPLEQAGLMDQLAELTEIQGHYDEALDYARRGLELGQDSNDSLRTANAQTRIGRILHLQGNLPEAEAKYREGMETYRNLYGDKHEKVAQSMAHLAGIASHQGRNQDAIELNERSYEMRVALFGEENLATIESMINLGAAFNDVDRPQDSLDMLNKALQLNTKLLGADHRDNSFIYNHRAYAHMALDDHAKAEADFRSSLGIVETHQGKQHPNYGIVLGNIGKVLALQEQFEQAADAFREAYTLLTEALPEHWIPLDLERRLGEAEQQLGNLDIARTHLSASFDGLRERRGLQATETQIALTALLSVLEARGETAKAAEYQVWVQET